MRRLAGGALLLAAGVGAVGAVSATEASAESCGAITISQGQNLTFDVSSTTVTEGGCVRFANLTDVTVTITVSGSSFSEKEPAHTPAYASSSYTATKSAVVTASDGVRTGHGDITVEKANSQPTTPAYSPPPQPPTGSGSGSGAGAGSSPTAGSRSGAVAGSGGGTVEPPVSVATALPSYDPAAPSVPAGSLGAVSVLPIGGEASGPPTASHPVVAPRLKSDDPRLTSTVLDPVGGSRRGLPAMVAAVLLVGLLAAYGRTVLAAAPAVGGHRTPGPVRP